MCVDGEPLTVETRRMILFSSYLCCRPRPSTYDVSLHDVCLKLCRLMTKRLEPTYSEHEPFFDEAWLFRF